MRRCSASAGWSADARSQRRSSTTPQALGWISRKSHCKCRAAGINPTDDQEIRLRYASSVVVILILSLSLLDIAWFSILPPHPAFGHPLPRGEGLGVRGEPWALAVSQAQKQAVVIDG